MKALLLAAFALVMQTGGWPAEVNVVKVEKGKRIQLTSVVEHGMRVQDLSMVSCIPKSERSQYRGNTVLYASSLPAHSVMNVTVLPQHPDDRVSTFAYAVDDNRFDMPSSRATVRACSAATWSPSGPSKSNVKLESGDKPLNVVIGVSGPASLGDTPYTMLVDVQ